MPEIEKEKTFLQRTELLRIIAAAKPGDEKDLVLCCLHLLGRIDEITPAEMERRHQFR